MTISANLATRLGLVTTSISLAMACHSPTAIPSRLYTLAVAGTVANASSNAPVAGATVTVTYSESACAAGASIPKVVTADQSGRFSALMSFAPYAATVCVTVNVAPPAGVPLAGKTQSIPGQMFKLEGQVPDTAHFVVALDRN